MCIRDSYDTALRLGLSRILNLPLTEEAWLQATLPIKVGGLGIRSVSQLALPAFLASAAGTDRLQSTMLSNMASQTHNGRWHWHDGRRLGRRSARKLALPTDSR